MEKLRYCYEVKIYFLTHLNFLLPIVVIKFTYTSIHNSVQNVTCPEHISVADVIIID